MDALQGIRVLVFPDPRNALCGRLLADMGADVVLIEPPGGARLRRLPPHAGDSDDGLIFWYTSAGCRSLTLDLGSPEGREALLGLAANTDVVVESFTPGHLASLGLGDAVLFGANPRLILASLTNFGQTGPYRGYAGSDIVAWAMSGMMSLTGLPEEEPLTAPAMQAFQVGSIWTTVAVLAAVFRRLKTGQGARIDLSLQETALDMSETAHSFYLCNREIMPRTGGDHPMGVPFKVYKSRDGHAFIGGGSIGQWDALVQWMKAHGADAGALDDPALDVSRERLKRKAEINAAVSDFALRVGHEEMYEYGASIGMGTAPVRPVRATLEDVQLMDRRFFRELHDPRPGMDRTAYPRPGLPFRSAGSTPHHTPSAPPSAGQHTDEVPAEWSAPGMTWPAPSEPERPLPLDGVRIVDLCWNVAGPIMGRVLGDLGATVVKVEPREIGDPGRMLAPFRDHQAHHNRSYTFQDNNRNKLSVSINMKHPEAPPLALKLAEWADVFLQNFTTGTLGRLGIPFEKLSGANKRLILGSITGYGQTGPRASWPSYHPTSSALSGLTGLFAYEGGEPQGFGNSYMDFGTGYTGAMGVLAALIRRERTGDGAHADISQLESAVVLVGTQVLDWAVNAHEAVPEGNRAGALGALLQDCFRCKGPSAGSGQADRWIVVTAPDDESMAAIGRIIGWADLSSPHALKAALTEWALGRDPWEAFELLQREGIPAGVVSNGSDLIERDEHLASRGVIAMLPHPELGEAPVLQCPILMDGERLSVRRAAPLLGEHTETVLRQFLGLPEATYLDHVVREVV